MKEARHGGHVSWAVPIVYQKLGLVNKESGLANLNTQQNILSGI